MTPQRGNAQPGNRPRSAVSSRLRSLITLDHSPALFDKRVQLVIVIIFVLVIAMVLRLAWVQLLALKLSIQAQAQRTATISDPAHRGRSSTETAKYWPTPWKPVLFRYPKRLPKFMKERYENDPKKVLPPEQRIDQIANELPKMIAKEGDDIDSKELKEKLTSKENYVVLVRNVTQTSLRR